MKKGDLRKQEILQTAETLFCQKGYEETSVQDILDILKTSKGSFYHHYVSKEALLEAICRKRAEEQFRRVTAALSQGNDGIPEQVNGLLSGMIPFRQEKPAFLLMLLPTFRLPEGRTVKAAYCDALADLFRDRLADTLHKGTTQGELLCGDPAVAAEICMTLVNRLWMSLCEMMLDAEEAGEPADPGETLHLTAQYRSMLERSLTLPFGCLELVNIPALKSLAEQIHAAWNRRRLG